MSTVQPGYRLMAAESTTTAAEQTHSGDVNSAYPLITQYHIQNKLIFLMWSLCHDFVEGSIFTLTDEGLNDILIYPLFLFDFLSLSASL